MSDRSQLPPSNVDLAWDPARGNVSFFGLDSVLFWTDPSLYRLLAPLVDELGVDLFRLLVAHSSSLGTDADYDVMVNKLGTDFPSGFAAWSEAVAAAGWGRIEMLHFDPTNCSARVRVHDPWELKMQQAHPLRWGCPFMQGKLIGLFTQAFGRPCWAEESHYEDAEGRHLELVVHASERILADELTVLRHDLFATREAELVYRIDEATAELRSKIAVIDRQTELIARLTYPILQVWHGVLAAVLIGELGDEAMDTLTYALLEKVTTTRARHVILDCTGVPSLSTTQAGALARLITALRLLGTQPVLVGIRPAVAECLAEESGSLAGVRALQTLADALQRVVGLRQG